jgi:catalase (peroxidase I)
MMLPADMALIEDPEFRKYVVEYAKDDAKFAKDFAAAFEKLLELGVDFKTTDGSTQGKNTSLWSRIFG